jgi:hypothetical protein
VEFDDAREDPIGARSTAVSGTSGTTVFTGVPINSGTMVITAAPSILATASATATSSTSGATAVTATGTPTTASPSNPAQSRKSWKESWSNRRRPALNRNKNLEEKVAAAKNISGLALAKKLYYERQLQMSAAEHYYKIKMLQAKTSYFESEKKKAD